jgi:branched-chain amino acid transport system substrate-binding protein
VTRRGLVALAATVLVSAGCGTEQAIERGGTVLGSTLAVYSSLPAPDRGVARDMVDGQKLALAEAHGRAGAYRMSFASLDEGSEDPAEAPDRAASVARQIIMDAQVTAVIGGLESEAASTSIPLLNSAGILHVSPGAAYAGFTGRVMPGEPERWFPSGRTTFARVIGDDRAQAAALLRAAGRPRRLTIEAEADPWSRALAGEVRRAAQASGVDVVAVAARADAVVYAGDDPENAAGVAEALAREAPEAQIALPDALVRNGVEARLAPAAARRAVFVSTAPEPGSTPELRAFEAAFERAYARRPGPYAVLGHTAMRSVLRAVTQAGPRAGERQAVIDAYFAGVPAEPAGFTVFRLRDGERRYVSG